MVTFYGGSHFNYVDKHNRLKGNEIFIIVKNYHYFCSLAISIANWKFPWFGSRNFLETRGWTLFIHTHSFDHAIKTPGKIFERSLCFVPNFLNSIIQLIYRFKIPDVLITWLKSNLFAETSRPSRKLNWHWSVRETLISEQIPMLRCIGRCAVNPMASQGICKGLWEPFDNFHPSEGWILNELLSNVIDWSKIITKHCLWKWLTDKKIRPQSLSMFCFKQRWQNRFVYIFF